MNRKPTYRSNRPICFSPICTAVLAASLFLASGDAFAACSFEGLSAVYIGTQSGCSSLGGGSTCYAGEVMVFIVTGPKESVAPCRLRWTFSDGVGLGAQQSVSKGFLAPGPQWARIGILDANGHTVVREAARIDFLIVEPQEPVPPPRRRSVRH